MDNKQTNETDLELTDLEQELTDLDKEAIQIQEEEEKKEKFVAQELEVYEGDEKIKLIPYPSYSEAKSVGTLLPINMANEVVTNLSLLSRQFDFIDFIKEKLGYATRLKVVESFASEQIDALVLAIKSFEKENAFILGDMAGIGKGRVCAGVMRYAYMQGFIPVFLSQKPYLFNDIYRDLLAIGGIGMKKGKYVDAKPFVMHNAGVITNRKTGIIVDTEQAYREDVKNNEIIYSFRDYGNEFSINELCISMTQKIESSGQVKLHKDFNCVMLPYSTLSHGRSRTRKDFLSAISTNAIFVFDESHNAASANMSSNILRTGLPLIENSKGVLFSSATYAKNPSVFNLYVVKTALRTAVPSLESIADALKVGGENVSEYIASGLAKEGQMIRRMRSFGDCKKITEFVGKEMEDDGFEIKYKDLADDNQRKIYDEAISYFKELRDFSRSEMAADAIKNAIAREVDSLGVEIADKEAFELAKKTSSNKDVDLQQIFIKQNKGKYLLTYSRDSISKYKATFRENLFLALKAKFSADKIIECLATPVSYKNTDGSEHLAPMKPIIAMANTGESIFTELRFKINQEVKNDFSEYLLAIYNRLFIGNFRLRKVDKNIFESLATLDSDGIDYDLIENEYFVDYSDFSDGGTKLVSIQNRLQNYTSELPFSVIDYLRERIESVQRDSVYFDSNGKPLYGNASHPYYRFAEATARKFMLKKEDGVFKFKKNDRIKSTSTIFRAFNSGSVDVMLINVVASTGGSAQSSPDEGTDTRPRNMFIVQFELDINIEVQKRGRINRTGQINSPTYTYIITQIPVELRKYLMFRKKLRKLDANVSADQTSTSKEAEITDDKGQVIEDIFNHYGYEVFKDDFIHLPQNEQFLKVFENLHWSSKEVKVGDTAENDEINTEHFNTFVRELELYPTSVPNLTDKNIVPVNQEYFFNQMNEKYTQKKAQLIELNEFQEELSAQNYLASLKQRVVVQLNSGSTVFSLPLFLSDYFTLDSKKPYSKDRRDKKANELAIWEGQQMTPEAFHSKLQRDILEEYDRAYPLLEDELEQDRPIETDFKDVDSFTDGLVRFEAKKAMKLLAFRQDFDLIQDYVSYFTPFKPVYYGGLLGMFVGYKILNTGTKLKYTKGNIEFIFCFLTQMPIFHTKLTARAGQTMQNEEMLLKVIKDSTNLFISPASVGGMSDFFVTESVKMKKKIEEWKPIINRRIVRRFMAGNILSGIVEANSQKKKDLIKRWSLTRFTMIDGTINTAIELKYETELSENAIIIPTAQPLSVSSGNKDMLTYISKTPISSDLTYEREQLFKTMFPVWNIETDNVIDRAVCIVRREYFGIPTIEFHFIQTVITQIDKATGRGLIKERKQGGDLYNDIYNDKEFQAMFDSYLLDKTKPPIKKIGYITYRIPKQGSGKRDYTEKFGSSKGYIKVYQIAESNETAIKEFLGELHKRYDVSFNFRSDVADWYNIESKADPYDKASKKIISAFPKGKYYYRFTKQVGSDIKSAIPDVLEETFDSTSGGVVLPLPMQPSRLSSYSLKPVVIGDNSIPLEILIKITLSEFNEEDKKNFAQELERRVEVDNEDDYEVGKFVRKFINERTVGTLYFFGDLQVDDIGKIFRDYALNQDLAKLIFEEKQQEEKELEAAKQKIASFADAENFILSLLQ
jgi:hypothetical protein